MNYIERRHARRSTERLRRLRNWVRRMMRRRGGFVVLLGAGACGAPAIRHLAKIRFTNAPQALRSVFHVESAWGHKR